MPDEQNIINDSDLQNVKGLFWFAEYITSLSDTEVKEVKKKVEKDNNKTETVKSDQ